MNQSENLIPGDALAGVNDPVHITILLVIMITAGILGGITGFMIEKSTKAENGYDGLIFVEGKRIHLQKGLGFYILIGVCASLLVPLFMTTISSELLSSSRHNHLDYFVFGGFCLIASISAHKFIVSISDKILKQVDTARSEIAATEDRIQQKMSESEKKKQLDMEISYLNSSAEKNDYSEFNREKAFSILDRSLSLSYTDEERIHVLSELIRLYFMAGNYDVINEMTDHYASAIPPNSLSWTNVAIANMNLYRQTLDPLHRQKSEEAAQKARQLHFSNGEPYAVQIYLNLIDYSQQTVNEYKMAALDEVKSILNTLHDVGLNAIYSAYQYFVRNEDTAFFEYNELLRKVLPDEYLQMQSKASEHPAAKNEMRPNVET